MERTEYNGKTIKLGKVVSCTFEKEWLNPISKKKIYYHEVITDMGEILFIGAMDKNSSRIKKGAMIEYITDDNNKTKLLSSSNDPKKIAQQAVSDKAAKAEKILSSGVSNKVRGQEAFLGFAWSYSKDLIIAGKTMKDVDELNKMARFIYDEIGKMLNNESSE